MQPDIPLLQQTILFSGIEAEELRHLLTCLGGSVRRYGRGEFLWHAGDTVLQAGIVLQGAVDAVQYREDGAMQLVARHTAGGVFGEMLMAAGEASPVSVLSPEGAEVLFLPLERIMEGCERHCEGHARLRMNLLRIGPEVLADAAPGHLSLRAKPAAAGAAVFARLPQPSGIRLLPALPVPRGDGGVSGGEPQRPVP